MSDPDDATAVPAIAGWFTTGPEPRLLGSRCVSCATVSFPSVSGFCGNPICRGREFVEVELSRVGTVWSYTDAQYEPPPPYLRSGDVYEPFALAAVELSDERLVVLGQVAKGYGVDDLSVGCSVELVVESLYELDGTTRLIYRWKPVAEEVGA